MSKRLQEKIAVITGGASGIGRAICKRFAEEGASIVVVDINADGLIETMNLLHKAERSNHLSFCGDVSDIEFAKQVFKEAKTAYNGTSNILVNCAGIHMPRSIFDMDPENFDEVIRVNLKGVFVMTKIFTASLGLDELSPKPVSIVNMSSIGGKIGVKYASNYCASKAGVIGFTQSIGNELAKYGVRCNAVLPGVIATPMTDTHITKEMAKQITSTIPMKRYGTAEEVANACLFLASEESSYVNCASLEVTGGFLPT